MTDSTAAEAPTFTQTRSLIERAKLQTRIWLEAVGSSTRLFPTP